MLGYRVNLDKRVLVLIFLTEVSSTNSTSKPCLDDTWTRYCKVSMGDVYTGTQYNQSITGRACVEGTVCQYDDKQFVIQCKVSSDTVPFYEECNIPLCSDLPLCDNHLEEVEAESFLSREGSVLISTAAQFVAAIRNHSVTEVWLEGNITISEDDLNGIPIFFRPGRTLVINKPGKARITLVLSTKDSLPGFFVFSGADVTVHRAIVLGSPLAGYYVHWERLGRFTFIDSESYVWPCSMISPYVRGLTAFQMADMKATVAGREADATLEFRVRESGVLPGGGGHAGTMIYDPERNLGGTHRYVNSTMRCNPGLYEPPPAPPSIPSPVNVGPVAPTIHEPLSSMNSTKKSRSTGGDVIAVGCAIAFVLSIGTLAACVAYRRHKKHAAMDCEQETSLRTGESGKDYLDCVQTMTESTDPTSVLSSAKLCEEIASVVLSVKQMTAERRSTRLHKAQDFHALAKSVTLDEACACSLRPDRPVANTFDNSVEPCINAPTNISDASSSALSIVTELQAGKIVNGYEYVGHLGSGTHAEVLLVRELDTGLSHTMKVPKDVDVHLVVQEAYLLAMLNHPNILKHEETFIHNGKLIVVAEYCIHGDLQQCLTKFTDPFPESFIRSVLFQLAFAVSHMHARAVAHRDIKPSNIFVSETGIVKLGDLGTGRVIVDTSDTFAGTPMFMAPQIIAGEPYTKECDVYSLGSVIYYLCSGKVAHSEAKSMDELKELQANGPDLAPICGGYSEHLTSAIAQMMSPSETLRPCARDIVHWEWLRQDPGSSDIKKLDLLGTVLLLVLSAGAI